VWTLPGFGGACTHPLLRWKDSDEVTSTGSDLGGVVSTSTFGGVEAVFASYLDTGAAPGLSYGVVDAGALVLGGGLGRTGVEDRIPDVDSVFRIASMTKSFTAAAVLMLRDADQLVLDWCNCRCPPQTHRG
jgi:CubicO group peptidase (beta-lactamase class C family)